MIISTQIQYALYSNLINTSISILKSFKFGKIVVQKLR